MGAMTSPQRLKTEALVLMLALSPVACDPSDMDTSDPPPPGRGRGPGPGGGPPGAEIPADELAPRVRELAARFDVRPTPAAPEVDDAMWVLGQALAFDKILSGNGDISCMTCHHPSIGSDDDRSLPLGVGGEGRPGRNDRNRWGGNRWGNRWGGNRWGHPLFAAWRMNVCLVAVVRSVDGPD